MLHHQASVRERRASDRKHQSSEIDREERAGRVGLLEDLLGGAQVGDERREHRAAGQCEPERGTNPEDFEDAPPEGAGRERPPPRGGKGLGLAQREPPEGDRGDGEEHREDRAPARYPEDRLTEGRSDRGDEDEHGEHERHETGHPASLVLVAHQGQRHDARPRGSRALQDAARDHHLERGGEDAHQAPGHEQEEAGVDRGPAAHPIRERTEDELTDAESDEQCRDDELDVVPARHAEVLTDRGQRGQHRVDRERHERHEERGERDELADPEGRPDGAAGSGAGGRRGPGRAAHGNSGLKSRSKPKARGPTSSSPASVWRALGDSSAITRTRWP